MEEEDKHHVADREDLRGPKLNLVRVVVETEVAELAAAPVEEVVDKVVAVSVEGVVEELLW